MRYIITFSISAFLLATPAAAETYGCSFKIPSRFQKWVPAQLSLEDNLKRGFGSVRSKLFDRFGKRALKADVVFENDVRKKFEFWFNNPDVRRGSDRGEPVVMGRAKYQLTIYKDGRPALFTANAVENVNLVTEERFRTSNLCSIR